MALTMFKKKSKKDSKAKSKAADMLLEELPPPPEQWTDIPTDDNDNDITATKAKEPPVSVSKSKSKPATKTKETATPVYVSKQGKKIVTSSNKGKFRASDVFDAGYEQQRDKTVPTAKQATFSGPPRYDWVDVESAAAIKVQSIFRRNQAWSRLENEGKSTIATRNRVRSRQANRNGNLNMAGEDVPLAMRFCGIGMLFGDATGEDNDALNSSKEIAAMKREEKQKQEASRRKFRMRKKSSDQIEEAIEVVDNIELGGDGEDAVVETKQKKNRFRLFGKS